MDEWSGRLRRVVQNMLVLLLLLFGSPYQSMEDLLRCLNRELNIDKKLEQGCK